MIRELQVRQAAKNLRQGAVLAWRLKQVDRRLQDIVSCGGRRGGNNWVVMPKLLSPVKLCEIFRIYRVWCLRLLSCFSSPCHHLLSITCSCQGVETAVPILLGLQWPSPHVGGVSVNPEVKSPHEGDLAVVPLPVWLTLVLCL